MTTAEQDIRAIPGASFLWLHLEAPEPERIRTALAPYVFHYDMNVNLPGVAHAPWTFWGHDTTFILILVDSTAPTILMYQVFKRLKWLQGGIRWRSAGNPR